MMEQWIKDCKPHELSEQIVNMLCNRTGNPSNRAFFRVIVAYYVGAVSSTMMTTVGSRLQNDVPTNVYAVALASSGAGL